MNGATAVVVPELGLTSRDALAVSCWFVSVGDEVIEGDRLVELVVADATFDVASPATGRLVRIVVDVDDLTSAGAVLGWIDVDGLD